jgi:hypothetical protein
MNLPFLGFQTHTVRKDASAAHQSKSDYVLKNLVDLGNGDSGLQVPSMDWFRVIFKNGKNSFVTLNNSNDTMKIESLQCTIFRF